MTMALPAAFLSEDQFSCSICLDVFNNPVSTPCGHSFCQSCISSYWDGKGGGAKSYQCPLCKESFRKRPELHINRTLKEITEQFKQASNSSVVTDGSLFNSHQHPPPPPPPPHHHPPAPSAHGRQGEMPGSIFAEMMTRFQQLPASGVAQEYPSNTHPQSPRRVGPQKQEHQDLPPPYSPPRRFTLSVPSDSSTSDLPPCPIHLRGLEYYCRTDNTCVCSACVETAAHRGHNIIPAKREWLIKKSQLGITEVELKDLISERQRKMEEIRNSIREIKAAAERETDGVVCAFSKLISSIERCQAQVLEEIEVKLREAEHTAQGVMKELEDEITNLDKMSATLSQLARSEDYIFFLETYPALSTLPETKDWSSVSVSSHLTSGGIFRAVDQMVERFQEEMRKLPDDFSDPILTPGGRHKPCPSTRRHSLPSGVSQDHRSSPNQFSDQTVARPNPKVRRVQEYAADITLDPNTAHPRLIISVDGKQVQCGERHHVVPDNPERFDRVVCVLAREGFSSGRHYWEVEVGGKTDWDLGVVSRSVNRKGKITVSPAHGYWFLSLRDRTSYAFRTEPSTGLTVDPRPSRVGIYVDCDKGLLSFYNVEARVLIYTFTDNFSDTIHPFFSPCTNRSGRNEAPLVICPVAATE
ncbi:E3 ubiquitin-protein ligase TRIM39-like isoform X2 [Mugil cephalus]|uniref:E3 ubiquitin-protein ligase TRIM39-like isoform X2 n=1 Tax=Mugil cephalus TaxID=48193 RepID=UPI001FB59C39|nr:E3 ubiquitin-protein ligase TRIM39-like isoform X2 [Mugil cephalus]